MQKPSHAHKMLVLSEKKKNENVDKYYEYDKDVNNNKLTKQMREDLHRRCHSRPCLRKTPGYRGSSEARWGRSASPPAGRSRPRSAGHWKCPPPLERRLGPRAGSGGWGAGPESGTEGTRWSTDSEPHGSGCWLWMWLC